MCQFLAYVGIIFFGRNMSHSFFVTVSRADHRTTQRASDKARQPGNLTIILVLTVAALLEADYPSLQEKEKKKKLASSAWITVHVHSVCSKNKYWSL